MEEQRKISKLNTIRMINQTIFTLCICVSALSNSYGAFTIGGIFTGLAISCLIAHILITKIIDDYLNIKQIFHFKGQFPHLENYGFILKDTVYTRITPRGNNTYTVYINFDKQIYCEKNGKEVPEFNFVISDLIRDGLVTVEREVI